ncbi:DUF4265 domain-containing protein [bacterium]|nr:DUF4265 domain-containing protein [bacterium]
MTSETTSSREDSEEVKTVDMVFAELDPSLGEDDYLEEPVQAVQVGPNRWRLEQNPMFTEMAVYKDTVEGDFNGYDVLIVNRVVEKSGLRTIRTAVPRMFYFSDLGKAFNDRVMELGGMWDMLAWGLFGFSYPESDHGELKELLNKACEEAAALGETETRPPSRLYKENPEGGTTK